ncbi:MAG: hypothetical protein JXJ04_06645 [Spirochaetales bacterium]|nr:hypothetical protein [Spirochaetales bacterium]
MPLGGSKRGKARTYINIWLTMLLSALWHGAGWNFILWGVIHAFFLSIERMTEWPDKIKKIPSGSIFSCFIIFFQVLFGWIFFRSENISQSLNIITIIFNVANWNWEPVFQFPKMTYIVLIIGIVRELYFLTGINNKILLHSGISRVLNSITLIILIGAIIFLRGPSSTFIYFQF